jgi:hypothetical protein
LLVTYFKRQNGFFIKKELCSEDYISLKTAKLLHHFFNKHPKYKVSGTFIKEANEKALLNKYFLFPEREEIKNI